MATEIDLAMLGALLCYEKPDGTVVGNYLHNVTSMTVYARFQAETEFEEMRRTLVAAYPLEDRPPNGTVRATFVKRFPPVGYVGALSFEGDGRKPSWCGAGQDLWAELSPEFDGALMNLRACILGVLPFSEQRPPGYIRVTLVRNVKMEIDHDL